MSSMSLFRVRAITLLFLGVFTLIVPGVPRAAPGDSPTLDLVLIAVSDEDTTGAAQTEAETAHPAGATFRVRVTPGRTAYVYLLEYSAGRGAALLLPDTLDDFQMQLPGGYASVFPFGEQTLQIPEFGTQHFFAIQTIEPIDELASVLLQLETFGTDYEGINQYLHERFTQYAHLTVEWPSGTAKSTQPVPVVIATEPEAVFQKSDREQQDEPVVVASTVELTGVTSDAEVVDRGRPRPYLSLLECSPSSPVSSSPLQMNKA